METKPDIEPTAEHRTPESNLYHGMPHRHASLHTVGKSIVRVDGEAKVSGTARYTADIQLPGMLYARLLRSPHAHAEIVRIDASAAWDVDGLKAVLTGLDKDMPGPYGFCISDTLPLAKGKVLWYGQPVAIAVADTPEAANTALTRIKIEYSPLPPLIDPVDAAKNPSAEPLRRVHPDPSAFRHEHEFFPEKDSNIFHHYKLRKGDVEAAFKECSTIVSAEVEYPLLSHVQLETHAAVALWSTDGAAPETTLTVWSSCQSPFTVRALLAQIFQLDLNKVRVIVPTIGGGFGGKSDFTIEPMVAWAAKRVPGRAVKLVFEREEAFTSSLLGRNFRMSITLGYQSGDEKKDKNMDGNREEEEKEGESKEVQGNSSGGEKGGGSIHCFKAELYQGSGGFGECAINIVTGGGHNCPGPYEIANIFIDSFGVYTNTPPIGAFRGYGHPEGQMMSDIAYDLLARKLGIDPVDFKIEHILMPGQKNALGQTVKEDWGDLKGCCIKVAEALRKYKPEFIEKAVEKGSRYGNRNRFRVGVGFTPFMKSPVMATNAASAATVRFNEDGTVQVLFSGTELGQGIQTVMAQIASEELKIPVERIHTRAEPDTRYTPYEWQTVGSTSTWKVGNAVRLACRNAVEILKHNAALALMKKLPELAHPPPNTDKESLEGDLEKDASAQALVKHILFDGEYLWHSKHPEEKIPLRAVVYGFMDKDGRTRGVPAFGYGYYMPSLTFCDAETGQGDHAAEWTFGCQGAVIEVDTVTGKVGPLKLITVMDIGKVINPVLARGQVAGAVVQALGAALMEKVIVDDKGKLRNTTLTDYKIPSPEDVPPGMLEIDFLENPYHDGPFGARCMAEHAIIGIVPAISNAIHDAIGIRLTSIPFTPEKIIEKLYGAPAAEALVFTPLNKAQPAESGSIGKDGEDMVSTTQKNSDNLSGGDGR
ncbi:MAG: xanthine dehydrogenase family protein molybdopterin-binding subunit [Thermoplasmata archaeon]